MNHKPLRECVTQRFEKESLTPEQLDCLQERLLQADLIDTNSTTDPDMSTCAQSSTPATWFVSKRYAMLLVAVALFAVLALPRIWIQNISLPERIAQEVARNHLKMKPLELESSSMAEIAHYFAQLDFNPIHSQVFPLGEDRLLGGRYCSIQGITAAQLRYLDEQAQRVTLYETAYDPRVFSALPDIDKGEKPLVLYAKGLKMTIWVEKDLLFVSGAEWLRN